MYMNIRYLLLIFIVAALYCSCSKRGDFITDSDAQLRFSVDTLRFDTVFTELGSATRFIKVYNPHKQFIRISKIYLGQGGESFFRMNVDGIPTNEITGVEIAPEDSLYIFAEVTVDPDAPLSVSPFVITDEILFETNNNLQSVTLEAWGQNANYVPNRFAAGGIAAFSDCNQGEVLWDDPKPYVIYGILFINDCTLRIPAGTRVYVHGGLAAFEDDKGERQLYNDGRIFVGPNGKLIIEGTQERPVTIQGDRLEADFSDQPAQWFGILFSPTSRGNSMSHTVVKNSIIGVFVDSLAQLSMKYSRIYNTAGNTLTAIHATVTADNCLFYNPGRSGYCALLTHGGSYRFNFCTLASYGVDQAALGLSNFRCYDPEGNNCDINRLSATIQNSIIFGSKKDEIVLADAAQGDDPFIFDVKIRNSVVRFEEGIEDEPYTDFFEDECENCIAGNADTMLFKDVDEQDFHLDTLSAAEQLAFPMTAIKTDLDGKLRDADRPDAGCYEFEE